MCENWQSMYQVTILLVLNFDGKNILRLNNETREHADKVKNTFIFNTFVLCQVFFFFPVLVMLHDRIKQYPYGLRRMEGKFDFVTFPPLHSHLH